MQGSNIAEELKMKTVSFPAATKKQDTGSPFGTVHATAGEKDGMVAETRLEYPKKTVSTPRTSPMTPHLTGQLERKPMGDMSPREHSHANRPTPKNTPSVSEPYINQ